MSVHDQRVASAPPATCENRNVDLDAEHRRWFFAETQSVNDVVRERLREARDKKGLSQRQLAEAMTAIDVPLDDDRISKIENGKRRVRVEELFAFAYVLEVPVTRLVSPRGGEPEVRFGGIGLPREQVAAWFVWGSTKQAALAQMVMGLTSQIQTMWRVFEDERDPAKRKDHEREIASLVIKLGEASGIRPGVMERKALRDAMGDPEDPN